VRLLTLELVGVAGLGLGLASAKFKVDRQIGYAYEHIDIQYGAQGSSGPQAPVRPASAHRRHE